MLGFVKNLLTKKEAIGCGVATVALAAAGLATGAAQVTALHAVVTTGFAAAEAFGGYVIAKGVYKGTRTAIRAGLEKAKGYNWVLAKGADLAGKAMDKLDNLLDKDYVDTNEQDVDFTDENEVALDQAEVNGLFSDMKTRKYGSYNSETVRPEGFKGKLSHLPVVGSYFTTQREVEAQKTAVHMTQTEIKKMPARTLRSGTKY